MQPAPDTRSDETLTLAVFGSALLLLSIASSTALTAATLMAVAFAGTTAILMRSGGSPLAQPIFMLCMVYFLAAGLPSLAPGLYLHRSWQTISLENLNQATIWMVRGFLGLFASYWFVRHLLRSPPRRALKTLSEEPLALRILGLIGVTGTIATIASTSAGQSFLQNFDQTASSLGQLLHYTTFFNLAYIYSARHRQLRSGAALFDRRLLLLALVAALTLGIFWGSKGAVLSAGVLWFAAGIGAPVKYPRLSSSLASIVLGAVGVFYLFAFVAEYRVSMQSISSLYGGDVGGQLQAAITSVLVALQAILGRVPWDAQALHQFGMILDRLGLVVSFAQLLEMTASISPHENALETALAPIFSILPRDVFPTKPIFFNSGSFAQQLGWEYGGFSVTLQGSLFWAWGWSGILIGCSLLGSCLAILQHLSLGAGAWSFVSRLAFAVLLTGLVDVGSTYQFLAIDTIRAGLCGWVVLGVAKLFPRSRPTARGPV